MNFFLRKSALTSSKREPIQEAKMPPRNLFQAKLNQIGTRFRRFNGRFQFLSTTKYAKNILVHLPRKTWNS